MTKEPNSYVSQVALKMHYASRKKYCNKLQEWKERIEFPNNVFLDDKIPSNLIEPTKKYLYNLYAS